MKTPTTVKEYTFSGSLCRIREFETADGLRYCITIFSLSDYRQLHFPHDEYKYLICKLYALQCMRTMLPVQQLNACMLQIKQPSSFNFQIKFGVHKLTIGSVSALGIVKTSPFADIDVFSVNNDDQFTCDSKWDICTCGTCLVFKRLIEFEATATIQFSPQRRPENFILFQN